MAIKGLIKAVDIINPKLKAAIVGESGIGKSWLACSIASAENQVMDLDFDGRAASLRGKENVTVKTYTNVVDFESDLNEWEYDYKEGKLTFQTFVIDSATYFRAQTEKDVIRQQPTLSRAIKVGSATIKIGQGYDVFNANRIYFENILSRLSEIANLIVCFHERNEKDETKSTPERKAFTGYITVEPQHLAPVLSTFNDVWRLTTDYSSKRILITSLSDDFTLAKTTLQGLSKEEEPDIRKLFAKDAAFRAKNGNASSGVPLTTTTGTAITKQT